MKNVLITGARGFIGFNAIQRWHQQDPNLKMICVDADTYADQFLIKQKEDWEQKAGIKHFVLDLAANNAIDQVSQWCQEFEIDTIVDFHAESHVDNSISNPLVFFQSNIVGTVALLEVARRFGLRFHYVSTDEVIGSISPEEVEAGKKIADENAPYDPSSPYSASKAGAEHAVKCYAKTFSLKATISRCTNNFGPWQHPEKLIPLSLNRLMSGAKIPIYGDGLQRRFWIHVNQHVDEIKNIILFGSANGGIFHIVPKKENLKTNLDLVKLLCKHTGRDFNNSIEYVKDRLAHDNCYWLETIKSYNRLSEDRHDFDAELMETVKWYQGVFK